MTSKDEESPKGLADIKEIENMEEGYRSERGKEGKCKFSCEECQYSIESITHAAIRRHMTVRHAKQTTKDKVKARAKTKTRTSTSPRDETKKHPTDGNNKDEKSHKLDVATEEESETENELELEPRWK